MKNILFAMILFFALTAFNIASAAVDFNAVNWDNAPVIGNREQFFHYLRECENRCQSDIAVKFSNGLFINIDECLKMTQSPAVEVSYLNEPQTQLTRALYRVNIYPGAKVAYAYTSGNTSMLNAEEKKLFNVAVQIVNEANKQPNDLLKEYYIHDLITNRVSYYTGQQGRTLSRHDTAVGALIDGRANCQGYTDAFYMLGKMLRLNVGKMHGKARGTGHAWNTITFNDGRIYAVDVTWDDPSFANQDGYNNYIYFNAPLEILQTTHTWEAMYSPSIYPKIDNRYFYNSQAFLDSKGKPVAFIIWLKEFLRKVTIYVGQCRLMIQGTQI